MTSLTKTPSAAAAETVAARGETYGHPLEDFSRTAALWNAVLGDRLNTPLNAVDVAQMMRMVKESRLAETPNHYDSLLDVCGYADCQYMVNEALANRVSVISGKTPIVGDTAFRCPKRDQFYPLDWGKVRGVNSDLLSPGVSVRISGSDLEWVLEQKLNNDGDMWRVRSAGNDLRDLERRTVELHQIEKVIA